MYIHCLLSDQTAPMEYKLQQQNLLTKQSIQTGNKLKEN